MTITTTTRVFRDLLFDPKNPKTVYGVAYGFWRSDDGGITWNKYEISRGGFLGGKVAFNQLLLDSDGTLLANSGEDIFMSTDKGTTWSKLKIGDAYAKGGFEKFNSFTGGTNFHIQSMARDPADPQTLYASLESKDAVQMDNLKAVLFSMGYVDDNPAPDSEVAKMQAILRSKDTRPQKITWDKGKDGIYVSHDNGATWSTSGLMIRSWLVRVPGDSAIYAVTADKTLSSCLVMESHPKLMKMLMAQFQRAKDQGLRSLHKSDEENAADKAMAAEAGVGFYDYPDMDHLLFHHVLNTIIYKSTDKGATWSRIFNPSRPLLTAMRAASEKQETALTHNIDNGGSATRGTNMGDRDSSTEVTWYDPFGIVMAHNYASALDGFTCSADGQSCFAYVPTKPYWDSIIASESARESVNKVKGAAFRPFGIGNNTASEKAKRNWKKYEKRPNPDVVADNGTFQLMGTADGGVSWNVIEDGAAVNKALDAAGALKDSKIIIYPQLIANGGSPFIQLGALDEKNNFWQASYRYIP